MDLQPIKLNTHKEKTKKKLSSLWNSMEIETKAENKNKKQRKNKLDLMSFIKCVLKAKKNKRKFTLFHPQMGLKNKTSFVQKRAINNLQLFTIEKHTQNSSVFLLTNKTTKSTKPTMITQQTIPQAIESQNSSIKQKSLLKEFSRRSSGLNRVSSLFRHLREKQKTRRKKKKKKQKT